MIDPIIAHRLTHRELAVGMPHGPDGHDPDALTEVRRAFAAFLRSSTARGATSWQQAWNSFAQRPVEITVPCSSCRGKRVDLRLGRACVSCMARGRIRKSLRLRQIPEPPA